MMKETNTYISLRYFMCLSLSRQSIYFNLTLCQRCLKFNMKIIRVMKLTNSEFFIVNFIHLDQCVFVELE